MMSKKHPLKSKTILFSLVTIIVAILNIVGVGVGDGDKPIAEMTWKELEQQQGRQTEQVTNLLVLLGGGGAIYGRFQAKDSVGGKKDEN